MPSKLHPINVLCPTCGWTLEFAAQTLPINVPYVVNVGLSMFLAGGFLPEYKMWGVRGKGAANVGARDAKAILYLTDPNK
ncbi:MAG: hypothetical protein DWQ07_22490 [Chloroflexi bacterium]|nr:MAG: hypothetical protein DWQ07_22490 [Chloroflexota bacterium]MBL1193918.1 hypothetical protein [Chloroflexota bacterium]